MSRSALALAAITILLWSTLAWFGARLAHVPPALLTGIALTGAGLIGALRWRAWHVGWRTWLVGGGGLLIYHLLYFQALRLAPPVEANLLNYLWPLLIVVLAPIVLVGHTLRPHHWLGALLGAGGAAVVITGGNAAAFASDHHLGHAAGVGAAITWALYSLLSKRLPPFPSAAVGGFCLVAGIAALAYALADGGLLAITLIQPDDIPLLALMAVGPMGIAFVTWDAALKGGDPRSIGALTYATPLLSTLWLTLDGRALGAHALVALALISAGAVIGSGAGRAAFRRRGWRVSPATAATGGPGRTDAVGLGRSANPNDGT